MIEREKERKKERERERERKKKSGESFRWVFLGSPHHL